VVTLEPLRREHFPLIVQWLNAPHVQKWWRDGEASGESVEYKYSPRIAEDSTTRVFVINIDGVSAGLIQCYRHADYPDRDTDVSVENAAGADYFIGEPDLTGRGHGSAAIDAVVGIAFDIYPDVDCVVAVPQAENRASCRALEKAGFTLTDIRDLNSDDPSDAGLSAIYVRRR
jgi:aminoglycoside 6'-N-acetyltransferase